VTVLVSETYFDWYFLATDKPSSFDVDNANVNGDADDDGKPSITMADANAIVNMFLGQ